MDGYIRLDGNKIVEARTGFPNKNSEDIIVIRDIIEPDLLIGKYYNPQDNLAYDKYNPLKGVYENTLSVSVGDLILQKQKLETELTNIKNKNDKFMENIVELIDKGIVKESDIKDKEVIGEIQKHKKSERY